MTQKGQKKRSWKNWIGGKFNNAGRWIKGHWGYIAGAAAAAAGAGAAIYLGTKDNGPAPPVHHAPPPAPPAAPPPRPKTPPPRSAGCSNAVLHRFRDAPCGGRKSEIPLLMACHPDRGRGTTADFQAAQNIAGAKARRCGYSSRFT